MTQSAIEKKIETIIEPAVADMGFTLVNVTLQGEGKSQTLQIMAEDPETRNLKLDDCAKISREIGALLDVEDPIKGSYRLEVSSPGIDRPLVDKSDFESYKGFEAKIEIDPPLETGQKRFRGILDGLDENEAVLLKTKEQGDVILPLPTIRKAKLVLTDELLKAGARS